MLKTTSPKVLHVAPKPQPKIIVPSAKAKTAFFLGLRLSNGKIEPFCRRRKILDLNFSTKILVKQF